MAIFRSIFKAPVALLLLLLSLGAEVSANENDEAVTHSDQDWVEQKINPSTEWVEDLFYPMIRWMERTVQGDDSESKTTTSPAWPIDGDAIPNDAIPPKQAASLLLSVHTGRVLKLTVKHPNIYQWKHLDKGGQVRTFYMDSRSGVLVHRQTDALPDNKGVAP